MSIVQDRVIQRFADLEVQCRAIPLINRNEENLTSYAQPEQFYAWATSALNAIQGVFGKESSHSERFELEMKSISNNFVWERKIETLRGVFLGAKSDVDGGHLREINGDILNFRG
ncbi:MAG: hypothetical protein Q7U76_01410 [Nitrospirota bacterium]|nr:hypothetical protein [Nitrospirota bacterium]